MVNIEFRIQLNERLGVNIFYDGGILSENYQTFINSQIGWNAGIGFTISTPLGPVRLDYAIPFLDNNINSTLNLLEYSKS